MGTPTLGFQDFRSPIALSRDLGASMLYSSRYSLEQLEIKQQQLIGIISEALECNAAKYCVQRKDDSKFTTLDQTMLEELSIVNEAILFARNDLQNDPDTRTTGKGLESVIDWFSNLVETAITTPDEDLTAFGTLGFVDAIYMMPIRARMRAIADAGFMTKEISQQLARLSKVLPESNAEIKP